MIIRRPCLGPTDTPNPSGTITTGPEQYANDCRTLEKHYKEQFGPNNCTKGSFTSKNTSTVGLPSSLGLYIYYTSIGPTTNNLVKKTERNMTYLRPHKYC